MGIMSIMNFIVRKLIIKVVKVAEATERYENER